MKYDDAVEKIALILISFKGDEGIINSISHDAKDMAIRASRGWWDRLGSPDFNRRMQKLRKKASV